MVMGGWAPRLGSAIDVSTPSQPIVQVYARHLSAGFILNLFLGSSVERPVAAVEIPCLCLILASSDLGLNLCQQTNSQSHAAFDTKIFFLFFKKES